MKHVLILWMMMIFSLISMAQLQVSRSSGKPMNALSFDGIDDRMIIAPVKPLDLSTGTVECWVRDLSPVDVELMRFASGNKHFIVLVREGNQTQVEWKDGKLSVMVPHNNWMHLAMTNKDQQMTIYLHGQPVLEIPLPFAFNRIDGITIGGVRSHSFKGSIDECRIWSVQRNPAQVMRSRDAVLAGNEAALLAQYSFDELVEGNLVPDRTGNGNNAFLHNFVLKPFVSGLMPRPLINLPVNPNFFEAGKDLHLVRLFWNTIMEFNTREYIVEKSSNGRDFTGIARIAAETKQIAQRKYGFVDPAPTEGTVYYRLKIINNDEGYCYSEIRQVR